MSPVKKASFALMAAAFAGIAWLRLGPVILAGLFSFMILDLTYRGLRRLHAPAVSRWLALMVFLLAAGSTSWMFVRFVRHGIQILPQIAAAAIPRLVVLSESNGIELPFENVYELREVAITEIKDNAEAITKTSRLLTARVFQVVIAVFIAILAFFRDPAPPRGEDLLAALARELDARLKTLMLGFEKILGAQVAISAVYTACTLLFLTLMGFSHVIFLTLATFIFGMLPVVGNIVSNTIIVAAGLTLSTRHAAYALAFLILIHKSGYFVYGRVLGSSLKAPMWQTLLAILLGEVAMGVSGIILAPALLHYVKEELRGIPAGPSGA